MRQSFRPYVLPSAESSIDVAVLSCVAFEPILSLRCVCTSLANKINQRRFEALKVTSIPLVLLSQIITSTARLRRARGGRGGGGVGVDGRRAGRRGEGCCPRPSLYSGGWADGFGFLFGFGPLRALPSVRPSPRPRSRSSRRPLVFSSRPLCSSDRTKYKFHLNPKLESAEAAAVSGCVAMVVWIRLLFLRREAQDNTTSGLLRPSFFPL